MKLFRVLASIVLAGTAVIGLSAPGSASPIKPLPAALAGHPLAKVITPADMVTSAWDDPGNAPGNCNANPSQVHLSGGNAELTDTGAFGNCTSVQSPHMYPTKDGYVYEATFLVSDYANSWPAFWMYGNDWPVQGEIDAFEINLGQNCVTWHYGTNNTNTGTCWNNVIPPAGANIKPGVWNTVDISFGANRIQVWYNGHLFVTIPETLTAATDDPMWVTLSESGCNMSVDECSSPADAGHPSYMLIRDIRMFT